jgi:ankyrin repeat protein
MGADPNIQDVYGRTALMFAAGKGHFDIVKLLLIYGANPHLRDDQGNTAYMYAVRHGHQDVAELLSKYVDNPAMATNNNQKIH